MQSTALALVSCEQAKGKILHPEVPRYDAIIFCDLGIETSPALDAAFFPFLIERPKRHCRDPISTKDCYQYNLEEWGLDSKASACLICPYHKNYFFHYIQRNYPDDYASVVDFDEMLAKRQPGSGLRNRVFL